MAEHLEAKPGKATSPVEPHVLFLSELACFSAQTLRCPQMPSASQGLLMLELSPTRTEQRGRK